MFALLASIAWVTSAHAQLEGLSSEQRRMIEQLPADQRREVMRRLQQERGTQRQARPEFPEVVRPDGERDSDRRREDDVTRPLIDPDEARRIRPGDTIVLGFGVPEAGVQPDTRERRAERVRRLENANPYIIDELGRVPLPGVGLIRIAGLTSEEAITRLSAEGDLRNLVITLTRLPLQAVGIDELEPFGYDLFEGVPSTFAPVSDIPIPAEYLLGPGDVIRAQLFGNRNADFDLPVSRDLTIQFPELGPISVAGLTFDQLREDLHRRVSEQFIGTRVSLTLGELRSIRVFVLGDVRRPGSYTVSSLTTMTNALFYSGGVETRGSLRTIELKRNGETVQRLDLYDLLLRGDTRNDARLRPGDVIFVPPVGPRVVVGGEVRRPAIYELRGESSAEQVLGLAGGLEARAQRDAARLERLDPSGARAVEALDLSTRGGLATQLRDGDVLRVPAGVRQLEGAVTLFGHVQRPGEFQWREGLRLTDLLGSSRDLKPGADLNYVLVRRETVANAEISVLSIDLQRAWQAPQSEEANPYLHARDQIHVFDTEVGRDHVTRRLVNELRRQTDPERPLPIARVSGRVKAPGEYPLEPGMGVLDLIRAGGGLDDAAFIREAELVRYTVVNGETREVEIIDIDLVGILAGAVPDVRITAYDALNIREVSGWREQQIITLGGEVRFPGSYTFTPGETLASVLQRAGGLTQFGSARGAVFTRETLREREREQIEVLARRLEADLSALALSDPGNIEAVSVGRGLLEQLRTAEATGRLVINLGAILGGDASQDIELRPGDQLLVPPTSQEVSVLGEVQFATSHFHVPGLERDGYIQRSGGTTQRADQRRIYVVRASGEVVTAAGSRWFSRVDGGGIEPGDTIVVPLETDRVRPLELWSAITTTVYNTAIAAAALNSF